jgi:hypothetical protein
MIKPTIYKSIGTSQLAVKQSDAINSTNKAKINVILQKLSELIKLKHS